MEQVLEWMDELEGSDHEEGTRFDILRTLIMENME